MKGMMNVGVQQAAGSFFDRGVVTRALTQQQRRVFSKFGAFVRQRARSAIRPARQKSLGEMSDDELVVYRIRARAAQKQGAKAPRRPLASSSPGEPPRSVLGHLKAFLFFAYDARRGSVVIGPALFNGARGTAPRTLEEGGEVETPSGRRIRVAKRPYMRPAFEKELDGLPALWAGAANDFGR